MKGEIDKLTCFIFDLDRRPKDAKSSALVRVLQWDRYCLENYLIKNRKLLFDELTDCGVPDLGSRGTFESRVMELALTQLRELVAKQVYEASEPDNPGLRPFEIAGKTYEEMASILTERLVRIQSHLSAFSPADWSQTFVKQCELQMNAQKESWQDDWSVLCSGKRLIDDIYQSYSIRIAKFDLKRRLVKRMKLEQTDDWRLIKGKIREALEASS